MWTGFCHGVTTLNLCVVEIRMKAEFRNVSGQWSPMISAITESRTESRNWPIKMESIVKRGISQNYIISLKCCFRVEEERMSEENCTKGSKSGRHNKPPVKTMSAWRSGEKTERLDIRPSVQSRAALNDLCQVNCCFTKKQT